MWFLVAALAPAFAQDAPCQVDLDDLRLYARYALQGWQSLDEGLFYNSIQSLTQALPCADAPVEPELAAQIHLINALLMAFNGVSADAIVPTLRAARAADPTLAPSEDLLRPGDAAAEAWLAAAAPDSAVASRLPSGADWIVDGAAARAIPIGRPAVVQRVEDDRVTGTWYIYEGDLPQDLTPASAGSGARRVSPWLGAGLNATKFTSSAGTALVPTSGLGPRMMAGASFRFGERLFAFAEVGYHGWYQPSVSTAHMGALAAGPGIELGGLRLGVGAAWGYGVGQVLSEPEGSDPGFVSDSQFAMIGGQGSIAVDLVPIGERWELAVALDPGIFWDGSESHPWAELGLRIQGR